MFAIDDVTMNRLADLIVRKLEKRFMRMPKEWRENVPSPYMLAPMQVPIYSGVPNDEGDRPHYFIIEGYIPDSGGLILRIKDEWGKQIAEKVFL